MLVDLVSCGHILMENQVAPGILRYDPKSPLLPLSLFRLAIVINSRSDIHSWYVSIHFLHAKERYDKCKQQNNDKNYISPIINWTTFPSQIPKVNSKRWMLEVTLQNMVLIVFSNSIYWFRIGDWRYVQGRSGEQLNAKLTTLHAKHAKREEKQTWPQKAIMEEEEKNKIYWNHCSYIVLAACVTGLVLSQLTGICWLFLISQGAMGKENWKKIAS